MVLLFLADYYLDGTRQPDLYIAKRSINKGKTKFDKECNLANEMFKLNNDIYLPCVGVQDVGKHQWMIVKYGGTTLEKFLEKTSEKTLPLAITQHIAKEFFTGLEALSRFEVNTDNTKPIGLMHRDLKPNNLLYSHGKFHIFDFGDAFQVQTESWPPEYGSVEKYHSPEYVFNRYEPYTSTSNTKPIGQINLETDYFKKADIQKYINNVDMWSACTVIFATTMPSDDWDDDWDSGANNFCSTPAITQQALENVKDINLRKLFSDCFNHDLKNRISPTQALQQPFITTPLTLDCKTEDCQNGGTCASVPTIEHWCTCTSNYHGSFCEQMPPCDFYNPCESDETCEDQPDGIRDCKKTVL